MEVSNQADAGSGQGGLDSLSISGFRGISRLEIPRLGRVALLAGKNGVGKTTVLEALRVYAARGRFDTLREVLSRREEFTTFRDEDGDLASAPALDRLFHQNSGDRVAVAIGPIGAGRELTINDVEDISKAPSRLIDFIVNPIAPVYARVASGYLSPQLRVFELVHSYYKPQEVDRSIISRGVP